MRVCVAMVAELSRRSSPFSFLERLRVLVQSMAFFMWKLRISSARGYGGGFCLGGRYLKVDQASTEKNGSEQRK